MKAALELPRASCWANLLTNPVLKKVISLGYTACGNQHRSSDTYIQTETGQSVGQEQDG